MLTTSNAFPLAATDLNHSDVDVLVIGSGPTGLGAAKRLHQIVRAAIARAARTSALTFPGRSLVDDCRQQRDCRWSRQHRCHPRRLRTFSPPSDDQADAFLTSQSTALRRRRPRYLFPLQVLRRLHRRGPSQRVRLVPAPAYLLRPLQGPMGPLPFPEQHFHAAQGGPGPVHGRHD